MSNDLQSLLDQGQQARRENRLEDALWLYMKAGAESELAEDRPLYLESLKRLGAIERDRGETEASLQHYRAAATLTRTLAPTFDSPLSLAHTVRHIGDILRESGQLAEAEPCYSEALEIYRTHPGAGTLDLANTLRGYALLQEELGQTEAAIALWQEAGTLYNQVWQEPGSPYSQADLAPGVAESHRRIALLSSR